jgi:predicted secreted protein
MPTRKTITPVVVPVIAALALALPFAAAPVGAQTMQGVAASPSGVLSLSARATQDIAQDTIHLVLAYEQDGPAPDRLADALNQRSRDAARIARGEPAVAMHTGAFAITPTYGQNGKPNGWRARLEVTLESRDFAAAGRLAQGFGQGMQISSVNFSLSPETRREWQDKLAAQAIAEFRAQAQATVTAFGYRSFEIREVRLERNDDPPVRPVMMRAMAMAKSDDSAPPSFEAGRATVAVTVAGSVQMQR